MIAINPIDSFAYDGLFEWTIGGRGEKIWRIKCWALVTVRRSPPPVQFIISKRTTSLKERKLLFEIQEQILSTEYNIVCTLAHNGP